MPGQIVMKGRGRFAVEICRLLANAVAVLARNQIDMEMVTVEHVAARAEHGGEEFAPGGADFGKERRIARGWRRWLGNGNICASADPVRRKSEARDVERVCAGMFAQPGAGDIVATATDVGRCRPDRSELFADVAARGPSGTVAPAYIGLREQTQAEDECIAGARADASAQLQKLVSRGNTRVAAN